MAFLDNSGDIILDAVLTDTGRRRMAKGNFRISKFAIGDDEIDYGLYNKEHPSGSAYYDLEILQTPVLEAFTQMNANINYGLTSYARQDLLYIPTIELNQKTFNSRIVLKSTTKNVIYLADDTKTNTAGVVTSAAMATAGGSETNILKSSDTSGRFVLIETGINSTNLTSDSTNQSAYITSVGLADNSFLVRYDNRFIGSAIGPSPSSTFSNSNANGATLEVSLVSSQNTRKSRELSNYNETTVNASLSRVYALVDGSSTDTSINYSAISGPRGVFTALNFNIVSNLPQSDYTKYGTTSNDLFADGTLFDFIDTTIYVQGVATNATIQLPIRIIKLAQT
tara:strand:+ start:412 stop:1428 length:1017 start_codon:yes stop_codon:yes gene_type:complete